MPVRNIQCCWCRLPHQRNRSCADTVKQRYLVHVAELMGLHGQRSTLCTWRVQQRPPDYRSAELSNRLRFLDRVMPESRLVILMASDLLLLGVGHFLTLTPQLPVRPDDLDNCAPPPRTSVSTRIHTNSACVADPRLNSCALQYRCDCVGFVGCSASQFLDACR